MREKRRCGKRCEVFAHQYDGAKMLVGRKRHQLVATEGLIVALTVHPTDVMG